MCICGGFLKYGYPQIIHFNRIVHYKGSILGIPHFKNPPTYFMTSDTTPPDTTPLKIIAYSESRSFRTPQKVINPKQALSRFGMFFACFFSMQNN